MTDLLEKRAAVFPDKPAFVFLSDRETVEAELSFSCLRRRAVTIAHELLTRGGREGDRALLAFPPGLDFFAGFFGCLQARIIGVPILPPRRHGRQDSSANILADCTARFVLTSSKFALAIRDDILARCSRENLEFVVVDETHTLGSGDIPPLPRPSRGDLAFLQYTSGSTSTPKGVMVSHGNLLENLEMIRRAFGNGEDSTFVSWAPLHHDMGLILNALQALYVGATCILMSPVSFLQRPLVWLRAISSHRAEVAGGPNFAFDLCVSRFRPELMEGIDLSSWKVAFNGAEPVRADTLRRFAATFAGYGFDSGAIYPCYGMAEATLLISGGTRGSGARIQHVSRAAMQELRVEAALDAADAHPLVGCGRVLADERLAIVEPEKLHRLPTGQVGEIWVRGPHVAQGYWQNEAATVETFAAEIADEPGHAWLRTGDLGFTDSTGEVFVTGRIKDVIIVRGVNHYPQDIEHTIQMCDAALRPGYGAAFTVEDDHGRQKLVVVQEVERSHRQKIEAEEIIGNIREAVSEEHELSVHEVALVAPGTIPKTTSGKIQRRLTRQLWHEGRLSLITDPAKKLDGSA
jgi:acyl-CoA synthetase (AMP-forming)/AMP-acid ligase II